MHATSVPFLKPTLIVAYESNITRKRFITALSDTTMIIQLSDAGYVCLGGNIVP